MLDILEHGIQCLIHFEIGAHKDEAATLRQRSTLVEGDFCIATTFIQLREDLLEDILILRVHPDLAFLAPDCPLHQPPHHPGVFFGRPVQDLLLRFFKEGSQERVPFIEDLLAGRPLDLDQFSVVLLLDRLHSELAEPVKLLLGRLFLQLQKIATALFCAIDDASSLRFWPLPARPG